MGRCGVRGHGPSGGAFDVRVGVGDGPVGVGAVLEVAGVGDGGRCLCDGNVVDFQGGVAASGGAVEGEVVGSRFGYGECGSGRGDVCVADFFVGVRFNLHGVSGRCLGSLGKVYFPGVGVGGKAAVHHVGEGVCSGSEFDGGREHVVVAGVGRAFAFELGEFAVVLLCGVSCRYGPAVGCVGVVVGKRPERAVPGVFKSGEVGD